MKSRKRKKQDRGVHELTELEVREVSLVDRPANGRRFSMVKNEDGADMEEDRIEVDLNDDASAPEGIGLIFKSLAKIFDDADVQKRLAISEEMKSAAFKTMRQAMRRIDTAMSTASMSETSEGGETTNFSKLIGDELMEVGAEIMSMGKKFGGTKATKTRKSDDTDPKPDDKTDDATSFASALTAIETQLEAITKAEIEKAGAKMKRSRLKTFEDAINKLTGLLAELKGKQFDPADLKKAEELETRVVSLEKSLDEAKGTIAKQAEALKKFRAARPPSAAIPVEKGEGPGSEAAEDTSWPMNMNNDPEHRKIDKSVDFR